ncbi:uncharacterized protein RYa [Epargyreus clarus]|uniref:uncharacterized protein RYa n=1 Tax=Epargyreus clarus TaxID=520877 RepID=UPI003C2BE796
MWRGACLLALLCAALAVSAVKRAEMSPVPFVLGSRYGRSPSRFITPRDDRSEIRFFLGSRYGKRSEAAGGGAPCDCTRYGLPRPFYDRKLNEERVPIED